MSKRTIRVVTIHPEFVTAALQVGVFERAQRGDKLAFEVLSLREYAYDNRGSVDGPPYGGGDGMILRVDVLAKAVRGIDQPGKIVLLSPCGKTFNAAMAKTFADDPSNLTFICGRFGGVDQRFVDQFVDLEISIGDFVTAGGELPGLTILEAVTRLIPGVLGDDTSADQDSFAESYGGLLEHPQYTRPETFEGQAVPGVLLSGNHQKIEAWRRHQRQKITAEKRADLLIETSD